MTGDSVFRRVVRAFRPLRALLPAVAGLALIAGCPNGNTNGNGNDNNTNTNGTPGGLPIPPITQPGTGNQNTPPALQFIWPTINQSIQDGQPILIRYKGSDTADVMRVNVFADYVNPNVNPPTATTIVLAQGRQLNSPSSEDSVLFDTTGLPAAIYTIRATISDSVNPLVSVNAPGQITIQPRVPTSPGPVGPPPPIPNVSPTLRLVAPQGNNIQLQQGESITIIWETFDSDDPVTVNVKAVLDDPVDPQTLPLVTNLLVPTGTQRRQTVWDLTGAPVGTWNVSVTAKETPTAPGQVPNADPQPVSFTLRVITGGTGTVNSPPTIQVVFPVTDAGVSNGDILDIGYLVSDPNSDIDTLTISYLLDLDSNAGNDALQPPIEIGSASLPAGQAFNGAPLPAGALVANVDPITIDGAQIPVRDETDEGGRPLPYFFRIKVDDGRGGVTNAYAAGSLRVLAPPAGVVDLLATGGSYAGATFQGFHGEPFSEGRGSRAGAALANIGDLDGDGLNDFAIAAQTATPFNRNNVGMVYTIYGRQRRLNPNNPQLQQGRYSGILELNKVGTFVNFPPGDPNFQTIFNIRGTQMYHPAVGGAGNDGITSLASWRDITGDGSPELLIGCRRDSDVADAEDNDPCDQFTAPVPPFPNYICFDDPVLAAGAASLLADVELTQDQVANPVNANTWSPIDADADAPGGWQPNTILDTAGTTTHITNIAQMLVVVQGRLIGAPNATVNGFKLDIQVEEQRSTGGGPPASTSGPRLPTDVAPAILLNAQGQSDEIQLAASFEPNFLGEFPYTFDPATGRYANLPPSVYDGIFSVLVRPNRNFQITGIQVLVQCVIATEVVNPPAFEYPDTFPDRISNTTGGGGGNTGTPYIPSGARELPPACGPWNNDRVSTAGALSGWFCNDPNIAPALGHPAPIANILAIFTNPTGPDNDDLFVPGTEPSYESGIVYCAASDPLVLLQTQAGTWVGQRTAEIGDYGQGNGNPPGCRFRGAWFQSDPANLGGPFFDQPSRFGQTIDTMPDLNNSNPGLDELLISAPGSGQCATGSQDLSADAGGNPLLAVPYVPGDAHMTRYTLLDPATASLNKCGPGGPPWTFANFSSVLGASLTITGQATRGARVQLQLLIDTPFGPAPVDGSQAVALLWPGDDDGNGDYAMDEYVDAPFQFTPFNPVTLRIPAGVLALLSATDSNTSGIWVELSMLDDCSVSDGANTASAMTIDSATWTLTGLAPDVGMLTVFNGQIDWFLDGGVGGDADEEEGINRPNSWPGFDSGSCGAPQFTRAQAVPNPVTVLTGNNPNEQFGWAKFAGDVNGDGNPDIACGSPGANVDPANANGPKLTGNGQSFLIYGRLALGTGPAGPPFERFEIRGSHDGDGFGQVQGSAGSFVQSQSDLSDLFVAAPGYDCTGAVAGVSMPNTGVDAGFVGVLYGRSIGFPTGETVVRPERIGTGNFRGCKFVGGSAGVRLGESVNRAGDFNADGFGDLLITSPGQQWPGARIIFKGPVTVGQTITINGKVFKFVNAVGEQGAGETPVVLNNNNSAANAERALITAMRSISGELLGVSTILSRTQFPDPLPDDPTVTFLSYRKTWLVNPPVQTVATNVVAETFVRQGVTYLVYGGGESQFVSTNNNTFVLPDDLNRRVNPADLSSPRVLRGVVFVAGYEPDTPAFPNQNNGQAVLDYEAGGCPPAGPCHLTPAEVTDFALFAGGAVAASGLASSGTQAYVVNSGSPADITIVGRPACEFSSVFIFDPASGATGATMEGRDEQGLVVATAQAGPPPAPGQAPPVGVLRGAAGSIRLITITVQGPAGSTAILDDTVISDPTPDEAAPTVISDIGDMDGDGFGDIIFGAPTADSINIVEPCNRRRSAGEAYVIYGNNFGLNDSTKP